MLIDATYVELDKAGEQLKITSAQKFLTVVSTIDNGPAVQEALKDITKQGTVPNVFVNGQHIGGCDRTLEAFSNGKLSQMILAGQKRLDPTISDHSYNYDVIVIGGGSGGLACSKVTIASMCLTSSDHRTTWYR